MTTASPAMKVQGHSFLDYGSSAWLAITKKDNFREIFPVVADSFAALSQFANMTILAPYVPGIGAARVAIDTGIIVFEDFPKICKNIGQISFALGNIAKIIASICLIAAKSLRTLCFVGFYLTGIFSTFLVSRFFFAQQMFSSVHLVIDLFCPQMTKTKVSENSKRRNIYKTILFVALNVFSCFIAWHFVALAPLIMSIQTVTYYGCNLAFTFKDKLDEKKCLQV